MRILSIDTTTTRGSVALSDDAVLIAQEQQGVPGTHSERLISSIDHLLTTAGWDRSSIEGIAVAIGPGSFMGLRIGLATAKGMALAIDCPIVGISSLASLSLNAKHFSGTVVSLIDARRGEIYTFACQFPKKGRQRVLLKESLLAPALLVKKLKTIRGELILVGDGVFTYGDELAKALGAKVTIAQGGLSLSQAINLAILALPRFKNGKSDDLAALLPNYIRRSDAEIGFQGKKK